MRLVTLTSALLLTVGLASFAAAQTTYTTTLSGLNEVPTNPSVGTGSATVVLNAAQNQLSVTVNFQNIGGTYTASHIHGPTAATANGPVKWGFVGVPAGWIFSNGNHDGVLTNFIVTGITPTDVANLNAGLFYVNVHSNTFPGGELRGQLSVLNVVPTRPSTWGRVKALYH